MPRINLLPKSIAEKIAAGEVVERPASVVKELVENSIDAGATRITVEIERGGITLIRITDNGCGIARADVPTAFLRHATSKISNEHDLDSISTLGFRGEALAAISAVSKVELITCNGEENGTIYSVSGGQEEFCDEIGCSKGTIITVRDIFFNVPARMKFLKKDVSEGNAVSSVVDRIALSHPEVAFTFIRDGKRVMSTSGDGNLINVICSVLGREFAGSLIPVDYELGSVAVNGFVCKPINCRPNRNYQFLFINGRLVKSMTVSVALDNAYKNSAMVGKYPACVLNLKISFDAVDVNVHPAKTEVRFSDEKKVFDCIYYAAKSAIAEHDTRPKIETAPPVKRYADRMSVEEYRQAVIETATPAIKTETVPQKLKSSDVFIADILEKLAPKEKKPAVFTPIAEVPEEKPAEVYAQKKEIRLIGEAFKTYIVAQMDDSIYLIDKHAAHERLLFEQLKDKKAGKQMLISAVTVSLTKEEHEAIVENLDLLLESGFEVEDFGDGSVVVRTVPANLSSEDVKSLISEIAGSLISGSSVRIERLDDIYHRVSCRSAIKAGNVSTQAELLYIAERILSFKDIMYCPHGRPVAFEISRRSLEKHFGRIQ